MEENESDLRYRLDATNELIAEVKAAIEKIDANIGELINRSGFILAISGLIAVAAFGRNDQVYLHYFLKWVLPYLIAALLLVFPALFLRKYIHIWDVAAVKGDLKAELQSRQHALGCLNEINSKYRRNFKFLNRILGLSLTIALLFVISFVVSFYLSIFGKLFSMNESLIFTFVLLLAGIALYSYVYFIKPKTCTRTGQVHD